MSKLLVGVLSDTHGRLDSTVVKLFASADHIVHAGDIEDPAILERLRALAPVTAVAGNCDGGRFPRLREAETVTLGDVTVRVRHSIDMVEALDTDILEGMRATGAGVVIGGHTHLPSIKRRNGILFLNPGSASLRRQGARRSVALLRIEDGQCEGEIFELGWDMLV